jgi:hypothetical protein
MVLQKGMLRGLGDLGCRDSCHPSIYMLSGTRNLWTSLEGNIRGVQDVRPNATGARLRRETLEVTSRIGARGHIVATKVGARVTAEAALRLVLWLAVHRVTDEHTETLCSVSSIFGSGISVVFGLTGLNAVTVFFLGAM